MKFAMRFGFRVTGFRNWNGEVTTEARRDHKVMTNDEASNDEAQIVLTVN